MAYYTDPAQDAESLYVAAAPSGIAAPSKPLFGLTNIVGAAVSLSLLVGVSIWGYRLMVRDVNGIPVVRAVAGEMRARPEDPGGELAAHQGLSVNAVAADGSAEAPADRLVLAPQPVALTQEDQPIDPASVAAVQQAVAAQQAPEAANSSPDTQVDKDRIAQAAKAGSVEDLVAALTDGVAPLMDDQISNAGPEIVVQVAAAAPTAAVASAGPGLNVSLRPRLRPRSGAARVVQASVPAVAIAGGRELDPATLPAGTRLVQLGAYDSADVARAEWAKFASKFDDLMQGKARVVQKATSGGRSFYRLRAHGFDDLADARRFCSALVAEGTDCIPVVTR